MDWFLPGIPPTGKLIEIDILVFIDFRNGLMAAERIYWDQASVLRQIGSPLHTINEQVKIVE